MDRFDPAVKAIELEALQVFSINFMMMCRLKGLSTERACTKVGICSARLYEMRDKTFDGAISIYTLCNLANFIGVPLLELFTPVPGIEYKAKNSIRKKFKI